MTTWAIGEVMAALAVCAVITLIPGALSAVIEWSARRGR